MVARRFAAALFACVCSFAFALGCRSVDTPTNPTPTPVDTSPTPTPTATPVPQTPYKIMRGALHVHSAYSHDACDGHGIVNGVLDADCIDDLRAGACATGLDFVALTDHPSHVSEYTMEEVLLYNAAAGDVLITDTDGPHANVMTCPGGHTVTFMTGYEGSPHLMPLGIRKQLTQDLYQGIQDSIPMATSQATVAGLKDHGAFVALAHSEEDDISASTILDAGIDGMEWYNPHANFTNFLSLDLLGGSDPQELIDRLGSIQSFLLGADDPAYADLVFLVLLQGYPEKGLDKWRDVQVSRPVTGLMGSDVHQNVAIDPICTPQLMPLCQLAAAAYPHVLTSLIAGGTIDLTDGERIDSYERVLRLVENRVLVEKENPDDIRAAFAAGRTYGVYTVFGDPDGFEVVAIDDVGYRWPIGADVGGSATMEITNPVPLANGGAPFTATEAADAEIDVKVMRVAPGGPVMVSESTTAGQTWTYTPTQPGRYYVEVWIKPFQFVSQLGGEPQLADHDYLWVITNPIEID